MNKSSQQTNGNSLSYAMFLPFALMIASVVSGCFAWSKAKQTIADDLNDAMIALADENRELWTRSDTIAALQQMHQTTHKPIIYQASDINFRNAALRKEAYFTLALVDKKGAGVKMQGDKIASDSILLVPEIAPDGVAIRLQGFANCAVASMFAASDPTVPGILLSLAMLSMASVFVWRRKLTCQTEVAVAASGCADLSLDGIKLTPMQRQLTGMLLAAPGNRVDKATLCEALWGNKCNAEESLYTLVRRTKAALADTGIEIICNRGDSYELRVNG